MTVNAKRMTLALFLLAVVAIVLVAAALPLLELQPGIPLPDLGIGPGEEPPPEPVQAITVSFGTLIKIILVIILLVVALYTGYKWRKQVSWKEVLVPALSITMMALIGLAILFAIQGVTIDWEAQTPEVLPPVVYLEGPPLGSVNPNLIWLVWIGLASGLILIGIRIFILTMRRPRSEDAVKREAELAMRALRDGSDIRNVIVRCYLQMSLALQKERGIKLEETMTARDFKRLLEARGIPHDPVRQLTRLFEEARYGHRPSGPEDERIAFDCLNAIVQSGRAARPPS
jgi:hypothetical protein